MKARLPSLVGLLSVFASPIFALAPSPSTTAANYRWVAITAGFSMAIASVIYRAPTFGSIFLASAISASASAVFFSCSNASPRL